MAALALKAIDYGAEQIPDRFFEKIPGGFFTPEEKRKNRASRKKHQDDKHREEDRQSRRNRSPPTDYSSYSDRESDYERERRRRDRDRARSISRSQSRGRDNQRGRDVDDGLDRDMAYAEQGQSSGPYFPPPPTSEHRPYYSQDHPSRPSQDEYRPSSAMPAYGYPPQPAAAQPYPTQSPVGQRSGASPVAYGEEAAYRYETIQNAKVQQAQQPSSYTAARYTPGPGYAPSPVAVPQAAIPPPPVGIHSPPAGASAPYAPYNPAAYVSDNPTYPVNGNTRPSQPPFYRQHSRSQPSILPEPNSAYPAYVPHSSEQVTQYDYPPSRRSSTKPERREYRHRARSADSRNDRNRESSRMSDMRGRFDDMDLRKKGLAAAVGGALAGGFAGRAMGKGKTSRLTTLAGVAAGALGGQAIVNRSGDRSRDSRRSPSRSRSRHRKRDDRDKSRERSRSRGLRARSRSIASRFRSKSRGRDDRDKTSDRGGRRPDHGYQVHEEYESFTESDSGGEPTRRHKRRTTKRKEY